MGLGIGISAMVAPMYLSEISPPKVRGTMVFLFQLAITIGLLCAFTINLYFAQWQDHLTNWRWMFGVGMVPAVLLLVGMFFMPTSPRWLVLKGRIEEAKKVLRTLLGKEDVNAEIKEMQKSLQQNHSSNWTSLFKKPLLPLLMVAFLLFVFQQLSGINAIMYYGPDVFGKAGFGEESRFLAQLFMGLTNVIATVLGVWIVDKVGRRPLLFTGFIGMIVCLSLLGFGLKYELMPSLSLLSIICYVFFVAISLGGVPDIMMSEVFPLKVRSSGMAIASCANWGFNMLVSSTFPILCNLLGNMGNAFLLYAFCTIIGLAFAYKFVPETKARQLEEIESNLYAGKTLRYLGDPVAR